MSYYLTDIHTGAQPRSLIVLCERLSLVLQFFLFIHLMSCALSTACAVAQQAVILSTALLMMPHICSGIRRPSISLKSARDDYSYVNTVALFFMKRGFSYVSVVQGGFAGAHDALASTGTEG
jgi:hypothetical protein